MHWTRPLQHALQRGCLLHVWTKDCSLPDTLNLPSPIVVAGRGTLPVPSCTELCPGDSGEEGTCTKCNHKLGCRARMLPPALQHGHPVFSTSL